MPERSENISSVWMSFREGDKEAFAFLYNIYVEALYRYGSKFTNDDDLVKDAIHEVFLDLYLKREKNKTDPQNLKYYLILSLKRNLIKKLAGNRRFVFSNGNKDLLFEPQYSIEKEIIEQEQEAEVNQLIQRFFNQLPSKQKEAIYLRFNQGLDYSQVAELLNISVESARRQVHRAIKTIRELVGSENSVFLMVFFRQL
jgi:RNA polymerase sigma factor (sigma-70 family)